MLPKVIHYCWFGGAKKPKLVRDCIKSWRNHLTDYEIIEWNESNCDLSHPFLNKCFELKKWAFVSDYIRLKVLYENGGIYLDTDMIVIKTFDNLLSHDCFFGAEDETFISCGIIGSLKQNKFIKECLLNYEYIKPHLELDWGHISIPRIVTDVFKKKYNFQESFNSLICVENVVVYPSDYFYPLPLNKKNDFRNYKKYKKFNTYAIHLWNSSWFEFTEFDYIRKKQYYTAFKFIVSNFNSGVNFNFKYFRMIAYSIKQSFKRIE